MSLEALRQMRRAGDKPSGIVKVVVGRRLPVFESDADVITIAGADQPQFMDWRAVVGLPVALFVAPEGWEVGEQAYDALRAAGAKVLGVAWRDTTIAPEAAAPVLHRMWGVLCR
jgi:hypothetical protein